MQYGTQDVLRTLYCHHTLEKQKYATFDKINW